MLQKEDNILINRLLKEIESRQISIPDQEIKASEINFACRVLWIINPT